MNRLIIFQKGDVDSTTKVLTCISKEYHLEKYPKHRTSDITADLLDRYLLSDLS